MSTPQTLNGLMRHLRNDCGINISGSKQKKQLESYGYYHGYKGYRFVKRNSNRIPFTDFSEVVAVIEYDNNLKAALYPDLMFIETAVKNIVCNETIDGLNDATFETIFRERMNDNLSNIKLRTSRLKLRNTIYSKIATKYREEENYENQMVRHFYNRGEDIPIWVIFETLYVSELAHFFNCLNTSNREEILIKLDMFQPAIDTNRSVLSDMIFTIKALRNSVAHNNIVFDTRFKDRTISKVLQKWLVAETGIQNITLYSLVDYIILVCCLLKRVDFSNKRARELIKSFKDENEKLKTELNPQIYSMIIQQNTTSKITALESYLTR